MQKDFVKLQKTLKQEIDDLGAKIKGVANSPNVAAKTRQIEKLLEKQLKNFEPALEKFYSEVKVNAGKYGIDLAGFEKRVKKSFTGKTSRAGATVKKAATSAKTAARKTSPTRAKKKVTRG
jgi:hypothetical protein